MNEFYLRITIGGKSGFEGEATSLVVPTKEGYYGIQANHSPVIVAVTPGKIKVTTESEKLEFETEGAVLRCGGNEVEIISK